MWFVRGSNTAVWIWRFSSFNPFGPFSRFIIFMLEALETGGLFQSKSMQEDNVRTCKNHKLWYDLLWALQRIVSTGVNNLMQWDLLSVCHRPSTSWSFSFLKKAAAPPLENSDRCAVWLRAEWKSLHSQKLNHRTGASTGTLGTGALGGGSLMLA